jgi:hypothetical protein
MASRIAAFGNTFRSILRAQESGSVANDTASAKAVSPAILYDVLGERGSDAEIELSSTELELLGIQVSSLRAKKRKITRQMTAYSGYGERNQSKRSDAGGTEYFLETGEDARSLREALYLTADHSTRAREVCQVLKLRTSRYAKNSTAASVIRDLVCGTAPLLNDYLKGSLPSWAYRGAHFVFNPFLRSFGEIVWCNNPW